MARFRSFPVRLPSGVRYWTVIGPDYRPVTEVDDYLLHSRLGARNGSGAVSRVDVVARERLARHGAISGKVRVLAAVLQRHIALRRPGGSGQGCTPGECCDVGGSFLLPIHGGHR